MISRVLYSALWCSPAVLSVTGGGQWVQVRAVTLSTAGLHHRAECKLRSVTDPIDVSALTNLANPSLPRSHTTQYSAYHILSVLEKMQFHSPRI